MHSQVALTLRGARDLLVKGWIKSDLARNVDGVACDPKSPSAVSFCALGAIKAAAPDGGVEQAACDALRSHLDVDWISDWNNGRRQTQGAVVQAFNETIKEVEVGDYV